MKKSILSLSAAVALGGLGFAGSANAWVAFDNSGSATQLVLQNAGTGHQLFTPYYTANNGLATLINIVNTDNVNGKAVKVRFRGATNSDDVLDFTLFLSPGDVWSGAVMQGADGRANLTTNDKSCTIPTADAWTGGVPFITERLPSYVTTDVQAALTREGYVEVLNMADIASPSPLFTATKHVNGVAPCLGDVALTGTVNYGDLRERLLNTTPDVSGAADDGLVNPTGGLMGSWAILDLANLGTYSGAQTAVVATNTAPDATGTSPSVAANMAFAPQIETPLGMAADAYTADPLLTTGANPAPIVAPLWFDLPDMSTPMYGASPTAQVTALLSALGKSNVINEYIATAAGAAVPFTTDWVVSQPTRRYHTAVDYKDAAANAVMVGGTAPYTTGAGGLLQLDKTNAFGPVACAKMSFSSTDREEKLVKTSASGGFSPGSAPVINPYCGEVFVAQFGDSSALQSNITNRKVTPVGEAGWASLGVTGTNLPMVGYAATLFANGMTGSKYGMTFPHRWLYTATPTPTP